MSAFLALALRASAQDQSVSGNLTVSGNATVSSTAASTSATTGALTVAGGAGVSGALNVGGTLSASAFVASGGTLTGGSSGLTINSGLTVFPSGYLSVGTSGGAYRFSVNGSAGIIATDLDGANGAILNIHALGGNSPLVYWNEGRTARGLLGFAAGSGDLVYRAGANYMASGTEVFRATSAGNFGIGTSSPVAKLDVAGDSNISGKLTLSGNDYFAPADLLIADANTHGHNWRVGEAIGGTDNGSLQFKDDTAGAIRLTLDPNGNVGIGTVTPAANLDVAGSANVSGNLTVGGTFTAANFGSGSVTGGSSGLALSAGGTNQNITLTPSGTGSTVISGNVGIGTSTPSSALDVTGVVRNQGVQITNLGNATLLGTDASGNVKAVAASALTLGTGQVTTALGYTPVNKAGDTLTGTLNFAAGSASSAPLTLQSGAVLSTPTFGAVEFDGTNLFVTNNSSSPTRKTLAYAATTLSGYGITDPVVLTSSTYADPSWITSLAASKLAGTVAAAAMPGFTGDVTSAAGSLSLSLADTGVAAGTYGKVTVDTKGRVTAGAALASGDVTNALGYTPYNATNPAGYITSASVPVQSVFGRTGTVTMTSSDVTSALGYTPLGTSAGALTGNLKLMAGTAASAPLTLQSGANLTTPVFGSVEFDGTNVYVTNNQASPTRKSLAYAATTLSGYGITDPVVLTSSTYADPSWITSLAASKLAGTIAAAAMPGFTGDVTSAAGSLSLSLADTGVAAGTYTKVTVDTKGRVTAGAALASGDVTTALGYTPYNTSNPAGYITASGAPVQSVFGRTGAVTLTAADLTSALSFTPANKAGDVFTGSMTFAAGTGTVAPFAFQSGSLLSAPTFGAVEFDGTSVYVTNNSSSPTRKTLAYAATTLSGYGITDPVVLTSSTYADPSWITSLAASKLVGTVAAAAMPGFSGDVTSSGGSTSLSLATTGVASGTYAKVTVDTKGRVIAGAALASADVTTALGYTPYNSSNPAGYITSASVPVQSVFGRTGAVTMTSSDVTGALGYTPLGTSAGALTGNLKLMAGTAASAPLTLQSGANLMTPVFGSVEFDGTNVYVTNNSSSPTRKTLAYAATTLSGYGITDPVVLTSSTYADPSWITSLAASKLAGTVAAAAMPGFTGDVTSSAGSLALSLSTTGVAAGTYSKVTVDTKGRVTAGAALASGDVTTALGFTPYNASNPAGYITSAGVPVQSVFGRTGAVAMTSSDVTTALGYTPLNATNGTINGGATGLTLNAGGTNQNVSIVPSGTGGILLAGPVSANGGIIQNDSADNSSLTLRTGVTPGTQSSVVVRASWNGTDNQNAYVAFDIGNGTSSLEAARFTNNRNLLIGGTGDITGSGGVKIFGATASLSPTSGALQIVGGVGVGGDTNVAGNVTVGGSISAASMTINGTNFVPTDFVTKTGNNTISASAFVASGGSLSGGTGGLTLSPGTVNGSIILTHNNPDGSPGTGRTEIRDTLAITNTGGIQYLLMGNQDSGGANHPAIIRAANGNVEFGSGDSWTGQGGNFTSKVTLLDNGNFGVGVVPTYALQTRDVGPGGNNVKFGSGTVRVGGDSDNGAATVLSVAPGVVNFDAPGVAGGRLTITSAGYVGIGTASPTSGLAISTEGSNYADGSYLLVNSTNAGFGGGATLAGIKTTAADGGDYNLLRLQNAAGTKFVVDGSGDVGIGVPTPAAKLDVLGTIRGSSNADFYNTLFVRNGQVGIGNNAPAAGTSLDVRGGALYVDQQTWLNGPVGIGTTTPASGTKLEVNGDTKLDGNLNVGLTALIAGQLTVQSGATVTGQLTAQSGATIAGPLVAQSGATIAGTANLQSAAVAGTSSFGATMTFGPGTNTGGTLNWGTNPTDALSMVAGSGRGLVFGVDGSAAKGLVVDSSGHIGVGTATPARLMHLSGTAVGSELDALRLSNMDATAGANVGIELQAAGNSNPARIVGVAPGSNKQELAFYTTPGLSAAVERVRIDGNGNVGLGTNTPSANLEVAGTTKLDGDLNVASTTGSSSPTDGALVVAGGTGVGGNLNVGGNAAVVGNSSVNGSMTVGTGSTATTISNSGIVTGGSVTATTITSTSGATVGGSLNVTQGATFAGTATFNSASNFVGTATFGQRLQANASGLTMTSGDLVLNSAGSIVLGTPGSTERMRVTSSGNVGIGTSAPDANLTITNSQSSSAGPQTLLSLQGPNNNGAQYETRFVKVDEGAGIPLYINTGCNGVFNNEVKFGNANSGGQYASLQTFNTTWLATNGGSVSIGTTVQDTNTAVKLRVNGTIHAGEVIVDTAVAAADIKVRPRVWADSVFEKAHRLEPLSEVEQQIKAQGHLPGIPSAKDVAANGISVADMQTLLLAKIEELTLHQIEQEKRIEKLEAENAALRAER